MLRLLYTMWRLIRTTPDGTVVTDPDSLHVTVGAFDAVLKWDHYTVVLTVDGQSTVFGPLETLAARMLIAVENRAERRERAKGYVLTAKGLKTQPPA